MSDMSGNKGCTLILFGIVVLTLAVAWLHDQTHQVPPMSDAEFQSRMAKRRAEQLQTCMKNVNSTVHLWPKELQKDAAEVIRRCANDDF